MSESAVTATVDLRDVERGLTGLLRAGQNIAPVLHALKKPLREDFRAHRRARRGPDGPWPALSAETIRKRGRTKTGRRRSGRQLGRLPSAVSLAVQGGDTLVATNKVAWAAVHQEGGTVGRGAELPARPFMYFSDDFLDDAEEVVAEAHARGWLRG